MSDKLNYKQMADFLGVPLGTLYAMVNRKQIPHIRLGKRLVRFSKSEIEEWIKTRAIPAHGKPQHS